MSKCASNLRILKCPSVETVTFGALDSVSSNVRRYPSQKDQAIVHFNITAGMLPSAGFRSSNLLSVAPRFVAFVPLEYETIVPLSRSRI